MVLEPKLVIGLMLFSKIDFRDKFANFTMTRKMEILPSQNTVTTIKVSTKIL